MMNPVEEGSKYIWCFCHEHDDKKKPNLSITKGGIYKGRWKCWACGATGRISKDKVDEILQDLRSNCGSRRTVAYYRKHNPIDFESLNKLYAGNDLTERKSLGLSRKWKIPPNVLYQYHVGYDGICSHTFPMYNENQEVIGIQRREIATGKKSCVEGSFLGLFIPNSINQDLVIVEGVSDASVATMCGFYGLGLPCATYGHEIARKFIDSCDGYWWDSIIVLGDSGIAGRNSADRMSKLLQDKYPEHITYGMNFGYSDLRDFYNKEGLDKTIKFLKGLKDVNKD